MNTIQTNDDELLAIEMSYAELTRRFVEDGTNSFACAAVMTKLALMIYKTSLSPEDYDCMVNSISSSRNQIRSIFEYVKVANQQLN